MGTPRKIPKQDKKPIGKTGPLFIMPPETKMIFVMPGPEAEDRRIIQIVRPVMRSIFSRDPDVQTNTPFGIAFEFHQGNVTISEKDLVGKSIDTAFHKAWSRESRRYIV